MHRLTAFHKLVFAVVFFLQTGFCIRTWNPESTVSECKWEVGTVSVPSMCTHDGTARMWDRNVWRKILGHSQNSTKGSLKSVQILYSTNPHWWLDRRVKTSCTNSIFLEALAVIFFWFWGAGVCLHVAQKSWYSSAQLALCPGTQGFLLS